MKKFIPVAIIIICAITLSIGYLKSTLSKISDFKEKEVSGKEILKCEEDIPDGFYDIEILEGPASVGLDMMDQGEVFHKYHIRKNSEFFLIDGKGKVRIIASKNKLLQGNIFEIDKIGNYEIGKDIAEGEYDIILKSIIEKNNDVGMHLWNSDQDQCIDGDSFLKKDDKIHLKLQEGQILSIYRDAELTDKKTKIKLEFRRFKQ